ncbi:DUF4153 domain-containing protein [Phaeobacter sp. C3_T13_0]|uniref:DUF4153 domain-containing protein n=1 Tax=Phaeobacter cretensis TaxID=3342641 RepID=UPI0039BD3847
MTDLDTTTALRGRLPVVALGAGSGFAFWLLARNWEQSSLSETVFLLMFAFLSSFCGSALAMVGPLSLVRVLRAALWIALPLTALMLLAAQQFVVATDLMENEVLVLLALGLGAIACPFILLRMTEPDRWNQFSDLSSASWGIAFRLACGLGFVAVFWILGFLSDALLDLVNITILEDIAEIDWLALMLSGAVFGLGLAVVQELGGGGAPQLLFRLLNLLLIPVLLVVGLFLAAIPLQGLSSAFGQLSSAATLMAMAGVMMTLVCVVLIRYKQPRGANGIAVRLLAVGLMLVAGLAVWAVVMRVWQYGWTPDRVYALCLSGVLLLHGFVYVGCAAIGGIRWPDFMRRSIVGLALATLAVFTIMLTPLIDAGRISTNSQIGRVISGEAEAADLPLWAMAHRWGTSGLEGLEMLDAHAIATQDTGLSDRLRFARTAATLWEAERDAQDITADLRTELTDLLPVRPKGATVGVDFFKGARRHQLVRWIDGCKRQTSDGGAGCVLIQGALGAATDAENTTGQHALLLFKEGRDDERLASVGMLSTSEGIVVSGSVVLGQEKLEPGQAEALLKTALNGDFVISPARRNTLKLGNMEVLIVP